MCILRMDEEVSVCGYLKRSIIEEKCILWWVRLQLLLPNWRKFYKFSVSTAKFFLLIYILSPGSSAYSCQTSS